MFFYVTRNNIRLQRKLKQKINIHRLSYNYFLRSTKMSTDGMTDIELRVKLAEHVYDVPPVTATTREVLLRRLKNYTELSSKVTNPCPNLKKLNDVRFDNNNVDNLPIVLFFDIETSGLQLNCDILQIAVKSETTIFNRYINPTQTIDPETSRINHLYNRNGQLYRNEERLDIQPANVVLNDLLEYLKKFNKKCVLVAHNCPFDATRFLRMIMKESMWPEFALIIDGFSDTLAMFRKKFPERRWKKGALKLTTLVEENFNVGTDGAHNAVWDVCNLEKLTLLYFSKEDLLNEKRSISKMMSAETIC